MQSLQGWLLYATGMEVCSELQTRDANRHTGYRRPSPDPSPTLATTMKPGPDVALMVVMLFCSSRRLRPALQLPVAADLLTSTRSICDGVRGRVDHVSECKGRI